MKKFMIFYCLIILFTCSTKTADNNTTIAEYSNIYKTSEYYKPLYRIDVLKKMHPQYMHPECIGYILFSTQDHFQKTGEIEKLFVEKEHRRHGYGSELFKKAIAFLLQHKYTKITWTAHPLDVDPETPEFKKAYKQLVNFYKKLGGKVYYKHLLYSCMQYDVDSKDFS